MANVDLLCCAVHAVAPYLGLALLWRLGQGPQSPRSRGKGWLAAHRCPRRRPREGHALLIHLPGGPRARPASRAQNPRPRGGQSALATRPARTWPPPRGHAPGPRPATHALGPAPPGTHLALAGISNAPGPRSAPHAPGPRPDQQRTWPSPRTHLAPAPPHTHLALVPPRTHLVLAPTSNAPGPRPAPHAPGPRPATHAPGPRPAPHAPDLCPDQQRTWPSPRTHLALAPTSNAPGLCPISNAPGPRPAPHAPGPRPDQQRTWPSPRPARTWSSPRPATHLALAPTSNAPGLCPISNAPGPRPAPHAPDLCPDQQRTWPSPRPARTRPSPRPATHLAPPRRSSATPLPWARPAPPLPSPPPPCPAPPAPEAGGPRPQPPPSLLTAAPTHGDWRTAVQKSKTHKYAQYTRKQRLTMDTLSEANGTFAISLLKKLGEDSSKNVFFSPMSISSALSMVFMGAKGNTAAQMSQTLSLSKSGGGGDVHQGFQALLNEVNSAEARYLLRTANRLFGEKTCGFLSSFKDSCQTFYQAEMEELDFLSACEQSREHINRWVAGRTEGKIVDLLSPGSVDPGTNLILVNAIYFKGNWDKQFNKEQTTERPFKVRKNEKKPVQMMFKKSTFQMTYIGEIFTKILVLPYVGRELNMIIMLPDENVSLETVETELTYEKFTEWTRPDMLDEEEVEVFLPRFKLEEEYDMKAVLCSLGMTDAFEQSKADFSGMSSRGDLYLSKVVHKSFVEVNEEGTEAAAASAAVMMLRCARIVPRFCADRPFLFFIQHSKSRSVLFCGRFSSP